MIKKLQLLTLSAFIAAMFSTTSTNAQATFPVMIDFGTLSSPVSGDGWIGQTDKLIGDGVGDTGESGSDDYGWLTDGGSGWGTTGEGATGTNINIIFDSGTHKYRVIANEGNYTATIVWGDPRITSWTGRMNNKAELFLNDVSGGLFATTAADVINAMGATEVDYDTTNGNNVTVALTYNVTSAATNMDFELSAAGNTYSIHSLNIVRNGDVLSTDSENAAGFKLYPNPASDVLNIDGVDGDVTIYNMVGEAVLSTSDSQIDVSNLEPGVYIVSAAGNNAKFVKK